MEREPENVRDLRHINVPPTWKCSESDDEVEYIKYLYQMEFKNREATLVKSMVIDFQSKDVELSTHPLVKKRKETFTTTEELQNIVTDFDAAKLCEGVKWEKPADVHPSQDSVEKSRDVWVSKRYDSF